MSGKTGGQMGKEFGGLIDKKIRIELKIKKSKQGESTRDISGDEFRLKKVEREIYLFPR